MTRITIIKDDNRVVIDGESHFVNCSDLPADFHALQWVGDHGEVEYGLVICTHCRGRSKKSNDLIRDIAPYQKYVDAWHVAKVAYIEEMTRKAAEEQGLVTG